MFLLPLSLAVLTAAEQPWKDKQIADWNEDDTKLILSDSPWAKTVEPTMDRSAGRGQRQQGSQQGGQTRRGGIGIGGIGIQLPGIGGVGRGGGGYPGGGNPRGQQPGSTGGYPGGQQPGNTGEGSGSDPVQRPTLTVRWESALPIREAELKARDTMAPTVDEDHYAIAVYGIPRNRMGSGNAQTLAAQLKKQASIKRDGKKDLAPSSVDVLQREDGPVVVYRFPRSKEITAKDKRIEFDAKIGPLTFSESFFVEDMKFQGKLEL